MMFLHYFSLGAVFPVLSIMLFRDLKFSGPETGMVLGFGALASILAPLLTFPLADRKISSERLLLLLNILSVAFASFMALSSSFWPILIFYFLLMMSKAPTFALTNSIALRHLHFAEKDFSGLRLFGTAGWVGGGIIFGLALLPLFPSIGLRGSLWICALSSGLLALWSLLLPQPEPSEMNVGVPVLKTAVAGNILRTIFSEKGSFLIASFLFALLDRYYFFGASFQLTSLGFSEGNILPLLGIGQVFEILLMVLMGRILLAWGFRRVFLVGALAQIFRFFLLGFLGTAPAVLVGIALHGFGFAFFFANGVVFLDRFGAKKNRSQVQLLYSFLIDGGSVVLGNLLAGVVAEFTLNPQSGVYNFPGFWVPAFALAVSGFILLAVFYKTKNSKVSDELYG